MFVDSPLAKNHFIGKLYFVTLRHKIMVSESKIVVSATFFAIRVKYMEIVQEQFTELIIFPFILS